MKHTSSRLLFSYWDSLRGERAAPDRKDVEPGRIRHVLADTFVLALDSDGAATFRLAGTRVSALFGRSLKEAEFAALWPGERRAEPDKLVDVVANETVGLVAGLTGTTELGSTLALELVLLPLRHEGATNTRLLGALSPVTVPSWLGLMPLVDLELRSTRVIQDPGKARPDLPPLNGAVATRRSRFVVLQGGASR